MPRHFVRDDDLDPDEALAVLDLADRMKKDRYGWQPLAGPKSVALMFDKPSTRTRISFSVGVTELGGMPMVLDSQTTQMGRGEPVEDTVRVLDRQVGAIAWRTFEQANLDRMAHMSRVPVINALSDQFHPCQVLADLQTIREHKGKLHGLTLSYFGDGSNNMAHSYLVGGAGVGLHVRIVCPEDFAPDEAVVKLAAQRAADMGGSVDVLHDAKQGAYGADIVTTDTWSSMGGSMLGHRELGLLRPFGVTTTTMDLADPKALVMHCLPAYRGKEISADVLDGEQSIVWDQAENRLHAQKAVLTHLLELA